MATLIDSSIVIVSERGTFDMEAFVRQRGQEPLALSAIGAAEMLHGLHRARTASQRVRRQAFLDFVLELMPVLPLGLVEARVFAELWARLLRVGTQVAERDLMIAATALARDYRVVTRDKRSFSKIPGLQTIAL